MRELDDRPETLFRSGLAMARPTDLEEPTSGAGGAVGGAPSKARGRAGRRRGLASIDDAIAAFARGEVIVVVDDENRENEGDLIVAAELVTPAAMAFIIRHTSGVVCVPMTDRELERLAIPAMVDVNTDPKGTAYTVSVDAIDGVSTGISAADRARTINLLAAADAAPADFSRPGHVFPLRARDGGVLVRDGHTEAGVDFARLAGLRPAAAIAEVVNDDGTMARLGDLELFADEHGLVLCSIEDLITWRLEHDPITAPAVVTRAAEAELPTRHGAFRTIAYRDAVGHEHLALVLGDVVGQAGVLTRVHSECLTGDVLGSRRCDCGEQLDASMAAIAAAGTGVVVYARGHEGRGIGLVDKIRAYALQDAGRDTVTANLELGHPADARDFGAAAAILHDLGVGSVRLLTNNPVKASALVDLGVIVDACVSVEVLPNTHNHRYLLTKRDRMGHTLARVGPEALPGPADLRLVRDVAWSA